MKSSPLGFVISIAIIVLASNSREVVAGGPPPRVTTVSEESFASAIEGSRETLAPRLAVHPAMAAVVAVDGKIVWAEAVGWANREAGIKATPATRFRLYSIAKALTGTLAARLAEQGKLDLDAEISRYLPDLADPLRAITIRQLLGHLSGVRHYKKGEWMKVSRKQCKTAIEAIAPFARDPLRFEPGDEFAYTSFGFVLASAVIEAVGEKPFFELLKEHIYAPAEMTHTTADTPSKYDDATAAFYWEGRSGKIEVADKRIDNSCKCGGGGLVTNAEDLARFGVAAIDGTLVNDVSTKILSTSQQTSGGERTGVSLGWSVSGDGTRWEHSGGSPGGRSYLLADRKHRIVVALMTNYEGNGLRPEANEILTHFQSVVSEQD